MVAAVAAAAVGAASGGGARARAAAPTGAAPWRARYSGKYAPRAPCWPCWPHSPGQPAKAGKAVKALGCSVPSLFYFTRCLCRPLVPHTPQMHRGGLDRHGATDIEAHQHPCRIRRRLAAAQKTRLRGAFFGPVFCPLFALFLTTPTAVRSLCQVLSALYTLLLRTNARSRSISSAPPLLAGVGGFALGDVVGWGRCVGYS